MKHAAHNGTQLFIALLPPELRASIDFFLRLVPWHWHGKLLPIELPPDVHEIDSVIGSVSATGEQLIFINALAGRALTSPRVLSPASLLQRRQCTSDDLT